MPARNPWPDGRATVHRLIRACRAHHWLMPRDLWDYRRDRPGPRANLRTANPRADPVPVQQWTLRRDGDALEVHFARNLLTHAVLRDKLGRLVLTPAATADLLAEPRYRRRLSNAIASTPLYR